MALRSNTIENWEEYEIEKKTIKEILPTTFITENMFDKRLSKFSLLKHWKY